MSLIGCGVPAPVAPVPGVVPDAGGLQVEGSPLRIDFWRAETGVLAAVSRLKGAEPVARETVPGCGDTAVWADGLRLVFVKGDFRGWIWDGRMAGVACS